MAREVEILPPDATPHHEDVTTYEFSGCMPALEGIWPHLWQAPHSTLRNLRVLEHLTFHPAVYISARHCPIEVTETWLAENGFPKAPVIHTGYGTKVDAIREHKVDVMIEDRLETYFQLRHLGIDCILIDQPWNKHSSTMYNRYNKIREFHIRYELFLRRYERG